MTSTAAPTKRGDGHLWAIALGLSLCINAALILLFAWAAMESEFFEKNRPAVTTAPPPPTENSVMIFPEIAAPPAEKPKSSPERSRFARTSSDQDSARPERPAFTGERNTQATSDRAPDLNAPAKPSQTGAAARSPEDLETTESQYREGETAADNSPPTPQTPPPTPQPDPTLANQKPSTTPPKPTAKEQATASPPPRTRLMEGPNPVEIPVPREEKPQVAPPNPQAKQAAPSAATPEKPPAPKTPPAPKLKDPAFRSEQRKTAIRGSISRNGRSALDVADSPLGRYQALISRAVEQEWQRNCARHRDFITPGFLTVRFFVEATGKVRTVQFVGEMETGEVQKGFTLNSIRNAAIPPMPAAVKTELDGETLELLFNFYF
jgi:outer membrane biosynthesis protein TonB